MHIIETTKNFCTHKVDRMLRKLWVHKNQKEEKKAKMSRLSIQSQLLQKLNTSILSILLSFKTTESENATRQQFRKPISPLVYLPKSPDEYAPAP